MTTMWSVSPIRRGGEKGFLHHSMCAHYKGKCRKKGIGRRMRSKLWSPIPLFWIPTRLLLCYTGIVMGTQHHVWQVWADSLHRWGLREFAAWLLEAIRPD